MAQNDGTQWQILLQVNEMEFTQIKSRVKPHDKHYETWKTSDDPDKEKLLTAVRSGKKDDVENALGPDDQPTLFYQETLDFAFKTACDSYSKAVIKILLRSGATAEKYLISLLNNLAMKRNHNISTKDKEILGLLLVENNFKDTGLYSTFVVEAVRVGSYELVNFLCQHGADPNGCDGLSPMLIPLSQAASQGRCDLIDLLISFKADINKHWPSPGPLYQAIRHGHADCIRNIIKYGGKILAEWALEAAVKGNTLETLKLFPELYTQGLQNVETVNNLLFMAARAKSAELLKFLLHSSTNILNLAESKEELVICSHNAEVLQLLVENGLIVYDSTNTCKYLLSNVREGRCDLVQICLDSDMDVNSKIFQTEFQTTPLLEAKTAAMTQLLIDKGARVNERVLVRRKNSIISTTALQESFSKKTEVLEVLLQNGADPEETDSDGYSALMLVSKSRIGHAKVKMLLEAGANVNRQTELGETALSLAVDKGKSVKTVKLLLDYGTDLSLEKSSNCTVVSSLLSGLSMGACKLQFLEEMLNHGAKTSVGSETAIQHLTLIGASWLIPKIIRNGCSPQGHHIGSPFRTAMAMGNHNLARYLVENKFLTKSDVSLLLRSQIIGWCHPGCQDLLQKLSTQPFPLETLCFVEVSNALGSSPNREDRVRETGLPNLLQTKLLFETEDVPLVVDEQEKRNYLDRLESETDSSSDDEFYETDTDQLSFDQHPSSDSSDDYVRHLVDGGSISIISSISAYLKAVLPFEDL